MITGHAWVFGDNLNSDQIMPVHYSKAEEEKFQCLHSVRPEFAHLVKPGDIIVAGKQCGIGSSRPAPRILKALGIGTVIAESFSGIFFRNSIAVGFPLVELPGATQFFKEGDVISVNFEQGLLINRTQGIKKEFQPYNQFLQNIIHAGGIVNTLKPHTEKA